MSLRARLTFLFTSLIGGVLLIFGALVYSLVSFLLLNQIDTLITNSANRIIDQMRITGSNELNPRSLIFLEFNENIYFQIWGNNHELEFTRPLDLKTSLDETGLQMGAVIFQTTRTDNLHLRVLSVPIESTRGPAGIVQVGFDLAFIDTTQRMMLYVLVFLTIVTMFISSLIIWIVSGRVLSPLVSATNIATQIAETQDLSRRIPIENIKNDEVGQLIFTFNDTLERLEKLFYTQRRFIADVSHELRTPLTVIKGEIGLMRQMKNFDSESLTSIDGEVDRLTRMVSNLLFLAQADTGEMPFDHVIVSLDEILLEVFHQMKTLAGDRISVSITNIDQISVWGDRDKLKQVLLNLISNAIHYTPPGGAVMLSLSEVDHQACLSVSDTGLGIPKEDLPHIFDRFYRGEKSRKRSQDSGFGLGLSIAYSIIEKLGGTIEVTSTEGNGSTFTVWLPLSKSNI